MRRSLRRAVVRTSELLSLRKTSARDLWDRENHQIRIMDMADMESWISQTSLESFAVRHSTRDCMFLYTYSVAPVRRVLLSDSFQLWLAHRTTFALGATLFRLRRVWKEKSHKNKSHLTSLKITRTHHSRSISPLCWKTWTLPGVHLVAKPISGGLFESGAVWRFRARPQHHAGFCKFWQGSRRRDQADLFSLSAEDHVAMVTSSVLNIQHHSASFSRVFSPLLSLWWSVVCLEMPWDARFWNAPTRWYWRLSAWANPSERCVEGVRVSVSCQGSMQL